MKHDLQANGANGEPFCNLNNRRHNKAISLSVKCKSLFNNQSLDIYRYIYMVISYEYVD